jgi:uncharacterized protein
MSRLGIFTYNRVYKMNKAILLGLGTIIFFGLGGYLIIELAQRQQFIEVLMRGWDIPLQIGTGLVGGTVSAVIALKIINMDFFHKERAFYQKLFKKLKLNTPGIVFVSLCAGIGEEIFFRAGIQPLLGVWLTSVLFVFLHGYLNPVNWRISIYGVVMVFIIAGFGYLFEYTGLITVMTAHTVFDIILLVNMTKDKSLQSKENA